MKQELAKYLADLTLNPSCTCNIETYTGNTESAEGVMLCNICGKFDTRATEKNTILHDDIANRGLEQFVWMMK